MASETEQPGCLIDQKYLLGRLLGKGAMSSVYEAEQISTGRPVALKLLHARYKTDHKALQRFRREAHVVTQLAHPNITEAYIFGVTAEGQPYLVLELIKGTTLADVLSSAEPVPWTRTYKIATQLCEALEYAHSKGVVHRDLKPGNIMLTERDTTGDIVRIVDFGVSALITDEQIQKLTQTGEVIGTPAYMSPEQCKSQKATQSSDIYALGCIIYELCCGQKPFSGLTPYEMMLKHTSDDLPPWQPQDTAIPASVKDVVYNAMAKNIEDRYGNAADLKRDLALACGNKPVHRHTSGNAAQRMIGQNRGKIATAALLSLVCVVAVTGSNMFFTSKPPSPPPLSEEEQIDQQLPYEDRGAAIEESATLLGETFMSTQDAVTVKRIRQELARAERYHTLAAQIRLDTSFADQWRRMNFYRAYNHLGSGLRMIDNIEPNGEADRNVRLRRDSWIADLFSILTEEDVQRYMQLGLSDIKHVTANESTLDDLARARIYMQHGTLYEKYGERTGDLPSYKKALPEYKKALAAWQKVFESKAINAAQLEKIKNSIGNSIRKIEDQH